MSTVPELEAAIQELPPPKVIELSEWLDDYKLALLASKRSLELLDQQEGNEDQQWLGE
jgi:hypothetical protein